MSWVAAGRAPAFGRGRHGVRWAVGQSVNLGRIAKPRIVALFALTVLAATVLAGPAGPALTLAIVASSALTVGGAAALNNYLERGLDARMTRTRRRPTAAGTVTPRAALAFGLLSTAAGVAAVWACGGAVAAGFAAAGAAWYVVVYTLLIKPRTAFSSLPGGLAGIFPALIGWTAAGGGLSGQIVFLCALIAVWSPPHFWALAFARQDDYLASGVPTPPVVLGEAAAARVIRAAAAVLVALTVTPVATGLYGPAWLAVALPAGLAFLLVAGELARRRRRAVAFLLYKLSGPYLAALLVAMVVERLARP
jgi:protoheme IX farnesyltransferase